MKTTTRFLLSASTLAILALAMVLTFSSCSDDDSGPSYGTCTDAASVGQECYTQAYTTAYLDPAYTVCLTEKSADECDEEFVDSIAEACIAKSPACGGASAEQCLKHFYDACPELFE
jgi:hypothetical protein